MIYFFQPLTFNIVVPYQLWIKQSVILALLVSAYYSNARCVMCVRRRPMKSRMAMRTARVDITIEG